VLVWGEADAVWGQLCEGGRGDGGAQRGGVGWRKALYWRPGHATGAWRWQERRQQGVGLLSSETGTVRLTQKAWNSRKAPTTHPVRVWVTRNTGSGLPGLMRYKIM
jgi:hypothetical protein